MKVNISELEREAKRKNSPIISNSIKIWNNFLYVGYSGERDPFDSYYDEKHQEFYIVINREISPFLDATVSTKKFKIPFGARTVKVTYNGRDLSNLTDEEYLDQEH